MDGEPVSGPHPDLVMLPPVVGRGFDDVPAGGLDYHADVVVVGSGPGGSAVARALTAGGLSVVVLEEGPRESRFRPNYANTSRYHMQEGGTMLATGTVYFPVAAGRGVGGGSLINSAICLRTPDPVLEGWSTLLGDDRYGPAGLGPVYDELEAMLGVGPCSDAIAGENNRIICRGAEALGLPGGLINRNTPQCVGCGLCNFGCPVGGKASVNRNLLPLAVADGAIVQAETRVDQVLVVGGRAVGVVGHTVHPETGAVGPQVRVTADRVVLSAGAIGTPRLLHACGLAGQLGPVGDGLHVHPGAAVMGVHDAPVNLWHGATQGAWFHVPDDPGLLPHAFTAPPEVTAIALLSQVPDMKAAFALCPRLSGLVCLVSDKGQGTVRATPSGKADISYTLKDADLDAVKRGLVICARVLLAGGANEVITLVNGIGRHTDADALAAELAPKGPSAFDMYSSHPQSSCRMGPEGVVGLDGQCHGLPGLYLADASVFPTSLGVNPQLTTMAMATLIGRGMVAGA